MRVLAAPAVLLLLSLAPHMAAAAITCDQIPQAQHFVDGLKPGPNTRAAQSHLDAAKHAKSDAQCVAELKEVDKYARRSAAADKRQAAARTTHSPARHVLCADALHQNRPGGTDYHGPPVAGCPPYRGL